MVNKRFGLLLSEGISSIAHRWHKTKAGVKQEMTQQLLDAGFPIASSTVAGWCQGFVPKEPGQIEWIVRYCVSRGRVDRYWADSLLYQARYPDRAVLVSALFPQAHGQARESEQGMLSERIDDPAFRLRPLVTDDLIGRDDVLQMLKQHLLTSKQTTTIALTGLPGVGKTTLAVALANSYEILERFRDGILWVNLGSTPDVLNQLQRWAHLLGLEASEEGKVRDASAYAEAIHMAIGKRQVLLVLEDAWQLEDALAFRLGGPSCAHILTTRFPHIALQFAGTGVTTVKELSNVDGIKLLYKLAPQVAITAPDQAQALVQAVGGLPLAITLLGRYLHVQAYHGQPRRLQSALRRLLLATERLRLEFPTDPLVRPTSPTTGITSSLMASIATSYQALRPRARSALRDLALFPAKPNTFSEEAALAITAVDPTVLDELADSGLLESSSPGRYTLHQTIADFALAKRSTSQAKTRMVEYFVTYVEIHATNFPAIEQEAANVIAALQVACDLPAPRWLLRGVNAFATFLLACGRYEIARMHLLRANDIARASHDISALATTLLHLGTLAKNCGDYTQAEIHAQEGLALARQLERPEVISAFLHLSGDLGLKHSEYAKAEAYAQEGLALARQIDNNEYISMLLNLLGTIATKRGAHEQAEQILQEGLALAYPADLQKQRCALLTSLGNLARARGQHEQAERYYQEGLLIARAPGLSESMCSLLQGLGALAGASGDNNLARRYFQEGLERARATGLRERMGGLLVNMAMVAMQQGDYEQAEAYLQEGLALAQSMDEKEIICVILSHLGLLETKRENYTQALIYLQEGLTVARACSHHERLWALLSHLISLTTEQENLEAAEVYLQEAVALMEHIHNPWLISGMYIHAGFLRLKQQRYSEARLNFHKALTIAKHIGAKQVTAGALFGLGQVAERTNDLSEAKALGQESLRLIESIDHENAEKVRRWLSTLRTSPLTISNS